MLAIISWFAFRLIAEPAFIEQKYLDGLDKYISGSETETFGLKQEV